MVDTKKKIIKYIAILEAYIQVFLFLVWATYRMIRAAIEACLPSSYEPKKKIKGEIALVTGGGGGLGQLMALRLSKLGATVVVWDINQDGIETTVNLVKGIGGKAYGYKCDISNNEDVYRAAKVTQKEVGDVTILINNAGIVSGEFILDIPDHIIKKTFEVNIIAHFWTVKAFLPKMIEKNHGHIVTISSMAGRVGVSKLIEYCSTKFATVGFDEALKLELQALNVTGVKTTLICPYFIRQTGMGMNIKSKFLPTLKANNVADRAILAILREEDCVIMPARFKPMMALRALFPFDVSSKLINMLVPDATPNSRGEQTISSKIQQ